MKVKNLDELEKFSIKLAKKLQNGDVISLIGDLGAGKTTLVQFLAKELGIDDYVTSPTFSIVNIYDGDYQINHLDLYRLENPSELEQIDYETYFYPDGITFIEWAKMGGDYLPDDMIEIEITQIENERLIEIKGNSNRVSEIGEF
ncbi:MAG: tRNA (adenosine(37)-N6)-threonylcarbamoyltransferase complex ATPase subunit type 1 TsaE [Helcococcus sp.]|nr:tRNA (adenosine(37)-N6)-threonylcarbamoyltransferase complex ATPase subunit type 1 TsaE [Helcococcus sp.]